MKIITAIICSIKNKPYLCHILIEPAATDKRHKIMKTMAIEIMGITHEVKYSRESKTINAAIQEAVNEKVPVNHGEASVTRDGVKTLYRFTNGGRTIIRLNK